MKNIQKLQQQKKQKKPLFAKTALSEQIHTLIKACANIIIIKDKSPVFILK